MYPIHKKSQVARGGAVDASARISAGESPKRALFSWEATKYIYHTGIGPLTGRPGFGVYPGSVYTPARCIP